MPTQILEVGPGRLPALWDPGTIFEDHDVTYTGVDALGMVTRGDAPFSTRGHDQNERLPGVKAPLHELPFEDDFFDIVIMRSVLGEYTLPLLKAANDEQPIGLFSSCSFYDTYIGGLEEICRVLGRASSLIISEEDTPLTAHKVSDRLEEIGFSAIELTPYNERVFTDTISENNWRYAFPRGMFITPDFAWQAIRSRFWNTTIVPPFFRGERADISFSAAPMYPTASYILTAKKP